MNLIHQEKILYDIWAKAVVKLDSGKLIDKLQKDRRKFKDKPNKQWFT